MRLRHLLVTVTVTLTACSSLPPLEILPGTPSDFVITGQLPAEASTGGANLVEALGTLTTSPASASGGYSGPLTRSGVDAQGRFALPLPAVTSTYDLTRLRFLLLDAPLTCTDTAVLAQDVQIAWNDGIWAMRDRALVGWLNLTTIPAVDNGSLNAGWRYTGTWLYADAPTTLTGAQAACEDGQVVFSQTFDLTLQRGWNAVTVGVQPDASGTAPRRLSYQTGLVPGLTWRLAARRCPGWFLRDECAVPAP